MSNKIYKEINWIWDDNSNSLVETSSIVEDYDGAFDLCADIGSQTPAATYESLLRVDSGDDYDGQFGDENPKRVSTGKGTLSSLFIAKNRAVIWEGSPSTTESITAHGSPTTFATQVESDYDFIVRSTDGNVHIGVEASGKKNSYIDFVNNTYVGGSDWSNADNFPEQKWQIGNYWDAASVVNGTCKPSGRLFKIRDESGGQDLLRLYAQNEGLNVTPSNYFYSINEYGLHGIGSNTSTYQLYVGGRGDMKIEKGLFMRTLTFYVSAGSYDYGDGACAPSDFNDGYSYKTPFATVDKALDMIELADGGGNTAFNIDITEQTVNADGSVISSNGIGDWNTIGGRTRVDYGHQPLGAGAGTDSTNHGTNGDNFLPSSRQYWTVNNLRVQFRGTMYNAQDKTRKSMRKVATETLSGNDGRSLEKYPKLTFASYQSANLSWNPFRVLCGWGGTIAVFNMQIETPDKGSSFATDNGDSFAKRYGYGQVKQSSSLGDATGKSPSNFLAHGTVKTGGINDSATDLEVTYDAAVTGDCMFMGKDEYIYVDKECMQVKTVEKISATEYSLTVQRNKEQPSSMSVAHSAGATVNLAYYRDAGNGCFTSSNNWVNGNINIQHCSVLLNNTNFIYTPAPQTTVNFFYVNIKTSDAVKTEIKGIPSMYHKNVVNGSHDNARHTKYILMDNNSAGGFGRGDFIMHLPASVSAGNNPSANDLNQTTSNSGEIMAVIDVIGNYVYVNRGVFGTNTDTIADDDILCKMITAYQNHDSVVWEDSNSVACDRTIADPLHHWSGIQGYTGRLVKVTSSATVNIQMTGWADNTDSTSDGLRMNTFSEVTGDTSTTNYTKRMSWHQTGVTPLFSIPSTINSNAPSAGIQPHNLRLCSDMLHNSSRGSGENYYGLTGGSGNITKQAAGTYSSGGYGRGFNPHLLDKPQANNHNNNKTQTQFPGRAVVQGIGISNVASSISDLNNSNLYDSAQYDSSIHSGASLEVKGIGGIKFPLLTSFERNMLPTTDGLVIYNTTNDDLEICINGTWKKLTYDTVDS